MVSQSIEISNMIIYILRHGEAEAKSSKKSDEERRLTSFGKSQLRKSLVIAKEIGTSIDLILSSPLVRARETAEIAKEIFNVEKLEIDESLEPTRSPYEVFKSISKLEPSGHVLLVTHQPLVSSITAALLNWNENFLSFSTGTMAMIEVRELSSSPNGTLIFLLPPTIE
jgi:phosphohistidine phosphatase